MPKIKKKTKYMESINKLSKMNARIINVNWIFETIKLKIWASEHVRLKRQLRNNMENTNFPYCFHISQYKIFSYFSFFSEGKRSSGLDFLHASRGWNGAHPVFFDQKSVKFDGSRMLPYEVISDWKMIFLHEVLEKFSVF